MVPTVTRTAPHTKTEGRCWKVGTVGLPVTGGRSFTAASPAAAEVVDGRASSGQARRWSSSAGHNRSLSVFSLYTERPCYIGPAPTKSPTETYG